MGSKETRRIPRNACSGRLVIVALSAQPLGVNELCVCVCVCVCTAVVVVVDFIYTDPSQKSDMQYTTTIYLSVYI